MFMIKDFKKLFKSMMLIKIKLIRLLLKVMINILVVLVMMGWLNFGISDKVIILVSTKTIIKIFEKSNL